MSADCRLCGAACNRVGEQRILDAHDVAYFLCPRCELLQTEMPYWLDEAYAKAMTALDTGAVQRNQTAARLTELVATLAKISPSAPALDYGGGHGVFVRMMRDRGFDFHWYDKFAENLYAAGFEGSVDERHAVVTAFEVIEHLSDVRSDLERMFEPRPDHVLVGTVLHHGYQPEWWYLMTESGQHVAFYTPRTLAWIGDVFGYDVIAGSDYSLFRRKDLPLGAWRKRLLHEVLRRPLVSLDVIGLVPEVVRRKLSRGASRVEADHAALRAKARS
jgi:hypothetical protein